MGKRIPVFDLIEREDVRSEFFEKLDTDEERSIQ